MFFLGVIGMKIKEKKKEKLNNVHFETNKREVKAFESLFIAHLTRKQNSLRTCKYSSGRYLKIVYITDQLSVPLK